MHQAHMIAPNRTRTRHCGTRREFTHYSYTEWHRLFTPCHVRGIEYRTEGDRIVDAEERRYGRSDGTEMPVYDDSVTQRVIAKKDRQIILLGWILGEGADASDKARKADSFLNAVVPVDRAQRFVDGAVGIGVGRWMKTLFMNLLRCPVHDRPRAITWFRELVRFVHGLTVMTPTDRTSSRWFDPIRETIRNNDNVEDILVLKLLQAVLRESTTRFREFRWFETSLRRCIKHQRHLRENMLMPLVWLYTDRLLTRNVPDTDALKEVFEELSTLDRYDDLTVVRHLLTTLFPALEPHADGILRAARQQCSWSGSVPIHLTDGSIIPPRAVELPLGLRVQRGAVQILSTDQDGWELAMTVDEYNHFTLLQMERPGTGMTAILQIRASVVPPEKTSGHGPGLLLRGLPKFTANTRAFRGVFGVSLAGGTGDGNGPITVQRPRPGFLLHPPAGTIEVATVTVDERAYTLGTPEWSNPIRRDLGTPDRIVGVFLKGLRGIRISLRLCTEAWATTSADPLGVDARTPPATAGMRFWDLVEDAPATPFQTLSMRAQGI